MVEEQLIGGRFQPVDRPDWHEEAEPILAFDRERHRQVRLWLREFVPAGPKPAAGAFKRVCAALTGLAHPRLATVRACLREGGTVIVAGDCLFAPTLHERLAQIGGALDSPECLLVLRAVADGLAALHASGLVHGGLTPRGIRLVVTGDIRLEGFGLGELAAAAGGLPLEPDAVSEDLRAAGSILLRMLTGQTQIVHPSELRADLSHHWDAGVRKLLAAGTAGGFESTAELLCWLEFAAPELALGAGTTMAYYLPKAAVANPPEEILAPPPVSAPPAMPGSTQAGISVPETAARVRDDVMFTVYRPGEVPPERWETLLAFAHLAERPDDARPDDPDPLAEVERQAAAVLGENLRRHRRTEQDARFGVPDGSTLTFVPRMDGITFNPPQHSFVWQESVHRAEFRLRADAERAGEVSRGRLTVFLGACLLAEIDLRIRVAGAAAAPDAPPPPRVRDQARPYRKIFASYSHSDLPVVEQFERFARSLGDEYLRDWVHLRAGEGWDERLRGMIREADIFQLFWSSHAMRSAFVRREWEYALSLGRPSFVRPTYWEEPMPRDEDAGLPTPELDALHFARLPAALVPAPHDLAPEAPPPAASESPHAAPDPAGDTTCMAVPPPPAPPASAADTARGPFAPAAAVPPVLPPLPEARFPPSAPLAPRSASRRSPTGLAAALGVVLVVGFSAATFFLGRGRVESPPLIPQPTPIVMATPPPATPTPVEPTPVQPRPADVKRRLAEIREATVAVGRALINAVEPKARLVSRDPERVFGPVRLIEIPVSSGTMRAAETAPDTELLASISRQYALESRAGGKLSTALNQARRITPVLIIRIPAESDTLDSASQSSLFAALRSEGFRRVAAVPKAAFLVLGYAPGPDARIAFRRSYVRATDVAGALRSSGLTSDFFPVGMGTARAVRPDRSSPGDAVEVLVILP